MTTCDLATLSDEELAVFGLDVDDLLTCVIHEHQALRDLAVRVAIENIARACRSLNPAACYLCLPARGPQGCTRASTLLDADQQFCGTLDGASVTGLWLLRLRSLVPSTGCLLDLTTGAMFQRVCDSRPSP